MKKQSYFDKCGFKKKYLNTIKNNNTRITIESLMKRFSEVELKYNKDIFEMNLSEITECLEKICYKNEVDLNTYKSRLIAYFNFCLDDEEINVSNIAENELSKISHPVWESICTKINTEYLQYEDIKELEVKINSQIDNPWFYNAILFGCFYGLDISELRGFIDLRVEHINFKSHMIKYSNGRIISLNDKPELEKYLKLVIEHDCEYSTSNLTKEYIGKYKDSVFKVASTGRIGNREYDQEAAFKKAIKQNCFANKINPLASKNITVKGTYTSGLLYYISNKIAGESLYEFLTAPKRSGHMVLLQQYICEFGSSAGAYAFKNKIKDYLKQKEFS